MVTVSTNVKKTGAKPRLMLHRIRDLITVSSTDENGLPYKVKINCPRLGVHIPKDFLTSHKLELLTDTEVQNQSL